MPVTSQIMQSSAASTSAAGSSAPVLEFVCLFTHDLKRKQKRWQDGRLKFHSFNKRIMVYDERGNFIGDTHWREDYDFGDGEEVQLERGGVMVQAAECVGRQDQDLSELIDKRVQEKAQRQSAAATRPSRATPDAGVPVVPHNATPHFQLRHTPLHSLLGTPSGHHGRALVPSESPFESRQRANALQSPDQQDESPRPAKKRRRDPSPPSKSGYAQSLFGATLTLSGRPMSSAPTRSIPRSPQVDENERAYAGGAEQHPRGIAEIRQVSSSTNASNPEAGPLAERRPTAVNLHRVQNDALIGKDARSKTNVPSLLRQTRPATDRTMGQFPKGLATKARNARRLADREAGYQLPQGEDGRTKPTRERNGAVIVIEDEQSLPKSKPKPMSGTNSKSARERASKIVATADGAPKATVEEIRSHPAQTTGLLDRVGEPTAHSTAAREPRIELRIVPTKKRGLLVLSERGTTKKAKSAARAESHVKSQEIDSSIPRLGDLTNRGLSNSIEGQSCQGRLRFLSGEPPGSNSFKKTSITNDSRLENAAFPTIANTISDTELGPEGSSSAQALVPIAPRAVGRASPIGHEEERGLRNMPVKAVVNKPQKEVSAAATKRNSPLENDYDHDFDEIMSRRPEHAPPPRLAKLSRRSVRSREVIGLFFDDDDDDGENNNNDSNNTNIIISKDAGLLQLESGTRLAEATKPAAQTNALLEASSTREDVKNKTPPHTRDPSYDLTSHNSHRSYQPVEKPTDRRLETTVPVIEAVVQALGETLSPSFPINNHDTPEGPVSEIASVSDEDPSFVKPKHIETSSCNAQRLLDVAGIGDVVVSPDVSSRRESAEPQMEVPLDKHVSKQNHRRTRAPSAPPSATTTAARPQKQPSRSSSDLSAANHRCEREAQKEPDDTTVTSRKPAARITNPATRGKKAAKPSDAAGQVPEGITPSEDRVIGCVAPKPAKVQPLAALPGFSTANGGPWSREAYDLFEYQRPA